MCANEKNLPGRLKVYNTCNPNYELLFYLKGDFEGFLHEKFEGRRHKFEWFILNDEDINYIREADIEKDPDYKKYQKKKWKINNYIND